MKPVLKILIPVILLVLLLAGGGILYRSLAPQVRPSTDANEESSVPAARHESEFTEQESELPAESAEILPAVETAAPEETETPVVLSNDPTADFSALDEEGNMVSLADYFGTPIVVNVWATWCPPCRAELPFFDAAAEKYDGQIRFMMIDLTDGSTDTVESATAFIRDENSFSFPLYFDVDFSAVQAYQINAIPVTLFIRADGSLLHQQIGGMDEATLDGYIQQLLAES